MQRLSATNVNERAPRPPAIESVETTHAAAEPAPVETTRAANHPHAAWTYSGGQAPREDDTRYDDNRPPCYDTWTDNQDLNVFKGEKILRPVSPQYRAHPYNPSAPQKFDHMPVAPPKDLRLKTASEFFGNAGALDVDPEVKDSGATDWTLNSDGRTYRPVMGKRETAMTFPVSSAQEKMQTRLRQERRQDYKDYLESRIPHTHNYMIVHALKPLGSSACRRRRTRWTCTSCARKRVP